MRRGFRVGDHLVRDDESGLVHYASEMRKVWDGSLRHEKNFERRNPQEFVRAKNDPKALVNVRTDLPYPEAPEVFTTVFVGNTNVPAPTGAASHLFDIGIGEMVVGESFIIR